MAEEEPVYPEFDEYINEQTHLKPLSIRTCLLYTSDAADDMQV